MHGPQRSWELWRHARCGFRRQAAPGCFPTVPQVGAPMYPPEPFLTLPVAGTALYWRRVLSNRIWRCCLRVGACYLLAAVQSMHWVVCGLRPGLGMLCCLQVGWVAGRAGCVLGSCAVQTVQSRPVSLH